MDLSTVLKLYAMSRILFFAFSLIFSAQFVAAQALDTAAVVILYRSPKSDIRIEKGRLSQINYTFTYDNPASPIPTGRDQVVAASNKNIDPMMLAALKIIVSESGFMELSDSYGAPEGNRFYPYSIEVKYKGKTKAVKYRSNPQFEAAPSSFRIIETFLVNL
jgi:hypothetical protein